MLVFGGPSADPDRVRALEGLGVQIAKVGLSGAGLSLSEVLGRLAENGVTRLLVEGGETVWRSIAEERRVDEVVLFQAGGDGKGELSPAALARSHAPGLDLTPTSHRRVGIDTVSTFRVVDLPRADVGRSA